MTRLQAQSRRQSKQTRDKQAGERREKMGAITAAMVKELRELTGAGMMDSKKALAAVEGDMEKAI